MNTILQASLHNNDILFGVEKIPVTVVTLQHLTTYPVLKM